MGHVQNFQKNLYIEIRGHFRFKFFFMFIVRVTLQTQFWRVGKIGLLAIWLLKSYKCSQVTSANYKKNALIEFHFE